MSLTDDDLLGKLIDWHNETDTVVRVDIDDPFIIEILQNRKLRELIERQKTNTKAILSDESPNKEELQRLLNLFDYLLEESEKC